MIDIKAFIKDGQQELAPYLEGVEEFVGTLGCEGKLAKTPLRATPKEEYVKNILAIGVLSHLNRQAFLQSEKRIVVLPDCLKNYGEEACCKADLGNASACTQCNSNCFVFESMERFSDSRTMIVLEPEDMTAFFKEMRDKQGQVGVVGVACALTLLSGFHITLPHKLPTQGVFLNYAACAHHWTENGENTTFSFKRMAQVLGKSHAGEPEAVRGQRATYSLDGREHTPGDFYNGLDRLARKFEQLYLPLFKQEFPDADLFELSLEISKAIVPNLITRDSA